jgi:hypothetical protein
MKRTLYVVSGLLVLALTLEEGWRDASKPRDGKEAEK